MPAHPRHFAYIDALRGYAILMVVAVHTLTLHPGPWWLAQLSEQGARGVQLFFLVSAFTLCLSWAAREDKAPQFYLRRLFRIAPMFWLAVPFFIWLRGWQENGIWQVATSVTFTHALWPDTMFGPVPGGWSVGVEAILYALFPFAIVPLMTCRWRTFVIVMVAAVVGGSQISRQFGFWYQNHPELWSNGSRYFFDTWFPREFPCFLFGVALYRAQAQGFHMGIRASCALIFSGVSCFVAMALLYGVKYAVPLGPSTTSAFCFFLIILGLLNYRPLLIVNPVIGWIGKVSYSVYFLHFAVLALPALGALGLAADLLSRFEYFAVVTVVSVALGSVTYVLIERPCIGLGRRVENALWQRGAAKSDAPSTRDADTAVSV